VFFTVIGGEPETAARGELGAGHCITCCSRFAIHTIPRLHFEHDKTWRRAFDSIA